MNCGYMMIYCGYISRVINSYKNTSDISRNCFHSLFEDSWNININKLTSISSYYDIIIISISTLILSNPIFYIKIMNIRCIRNFLLTKVANICNKRASFEREGKIFKNNEDIHRQSSFIAQSSINLKQRETRVESVIRKNFLKMKKSLDITNSAQAKENEDYKYTKIELIVISFIDLIFVLLILLIGTTIVILIRSIWEDSPMAFYMGFSTYCFISFIILNLFVKFFNSEIYSYKCMLLRKKNINSIGRKIIATIPSIIFTLLMIFFGNLIINEQKKIVFLSWLLLVIICFSCYYKYSIKPHLLINKLNY